MFPPAADMRWPPRDDRHPQTGAFAVPMSKRATNCARAAARNASMGTALLDGSRKERKPMRVTSSMISSLPVSVVDAYRLARRPQPFESWRRPSARPPVEKRDDTFVPQPLYAPVPQPPEPP